MPVTRASALELGRGQRRGDGAARTVAAPFRRCCAGTLGTGPDRIDRRKARPLVLAQQASKLGVFLSEATDLVLVHPGLLVQHDSTAGAVSVNRVADRGPARESLGIGRGAIPNPIEHGQDAGRLWRRAVFMRQVRSPNDPRHPAKRRVPHLVFLEQALECAASIPVAKLRPTDVEWDTRQPCHVACPRDELKRRGGVDKAADRPRGCDSVNVNSLSSDEVHAKNDAMS